MFSFYRRENRSVGFSSLLKVAQPDKCLPLYTSFYMTYNWAYFCSLTFSIHWVLGNFLHVLIKVNPTWMYIAF